MSLILKKERSAGKRKHRQVFELKKDDETAQVTTLHKTVRDVCRSPGIDRTVENQPDKSGTHNDRNGKGTVIIIIIITTNTVDTQWRS